MDVPLWSYAKSNLVSSLVTHITIANPYSHFYKILENRLVIVYCRLGL